MGEWLSGKIGRGREREGERQGEKKKERERKRERGNERACIDSFHSPRSLMSVWKRHSEDTHKEMAMALWLACRPYQSELRPPSVVVQVNSTASAWFTKEEQGNVNHH